MVLLDDCVDGTFELSSSGALRDGTAADGVVGGPRCAYYLKVNINDWKYTSSKVNCK